MRVDGELVPPSHESTIQIRKQQSSLKHQGEQQHPH